ncbi:MAG: hypothetical protein WC515_01440 [Candidatus Omnitrophota bacterium]
MKKALIFMGILVSAACSTAALALDFSADMVSTTRAGSFTGKIFAAKDKVRMDMAGAVTITRMDKDVAWVLMPQQNMYMEQKLDPERIAGATEKMPGEMERTLVGKDTVDGKMTDKYLIVYTSKEGRATVFQWIDPVSGIPLKTAAEDGSWSVEYRNLMVGAQDDSLFEIPSGYQKFAMPDISDMMKGMRE